MKYVVQLQTAQQRPNIIMTFFTECLVQIHKCAASFHLESKVRATFKKYFIGCTRTDLTYRKKNHHCPIYDYFLRILYTRSKPSPHVYWRFLILPKYLNPQFRRLVSFWEIFRSRKPKFCHNIIQNNSFSIVIKLLKPQRVFLAMLR